MRLFTPTTRTTVTRTITTRRRFFTHRVLSATRTTTITTNHHGRSHIRAYSSEKGTTPPSPLSSQSQSSSAFNPETYLQTATTTLSLIPPKLIPDTLHPTQSHLLSLALSSHLPSICLPPGFKNSSPSSSSSPPPRPSPSSSSSSSSSSSTSIFPWPRDQEEYNQQLPPGYHLIYYPLQTPPHLLFPDGTDADHCPGGPFTRRMWAGGRIEFGRGSAEKFRVDGGRKTICVETLGTPPVLQVGKGGAGSEQEQRVWVDVWRRYLTFPEGMRGGEEMEKMVEGVVRDLQAAGAQEGGTSTSTTPNPPTKEGVISELRRLVFLRERPDPVPGHQKLEPDPAPARVIKVPHHPDFSFKMTPDATLLFQFSALTFNAHAIHLDPLYAREVEGYKERLVHGPLTLVVMLRGVEGFLRGGTSGAGAGAGAGSTMTAAAADSAGTQISEAIRKRLFVPEEEEPEDGKKKKQQWEIASIEYKNLRPLFVGEEMKVCVRLLPNKEKKSSGSSDKAGLSGLDGGRRERVDVWIEAPDGGLAVKGTVGVEWR